MEHTLARIEAMLKKLYENSFGPMPEATPALAPPTEPEAPTPAPAAAEPPAAPPAAA